MTLFLSPLTAIVQFFSNLGAPLAGGTVSTYEAGTSTATPTWTDSTGDTENSNPLVLNAYGRYQNVAIWQQDGVPIKAVIADSAGNTIATIDQIAGINDIDIATTILTNPASGDGADIVANATRSYGTFSQARASNTPVMQSGQTLVVIFEGGNAVADGLGGEFYWDPFNSTADDGLNTIAPNGTTTGRYLRLSSIPVPDYAVKNSDTTVTSSTTVVADPALQLQITSPGTYSIECWLNDSGGTSSGGLKGTMAYSGTASAGAWAMNGNGGDVTTVPLTALGTATQLQSAQAGTASMKIDGFLVCSTGGTLSFNWAQNSSNATGSLIATGSWIRLIRLSTQTSSFQPVSHVYTSGSGAETIPTGATTLTIEVFGASGNGGNWVAGASGDGGGGAAGGYARSTYTVSSANSDTIDYSVGAVGSSSTVSAGTFSITTMTATAGTSGSNATSGGYGNGGTGGAGSGGNVSNQFGQNGQSGYTGNPGEGGGIGAPGVNGVYGSGEGGGNGGISSLSPSGGSGGAGLVIFRYT